MSSDSSALQNQYLPIPQPQQQPGLIVRVWNLILNNPSAPYVLSLYLQLFINAVVVFTLIAAAAILFAKVRTDIAHQNSEYASAHSIQVARCAREFLLNKCPQDPLDPVRPSIASRCDELRKCRDSAPTRLGGAKVAAETLGIIIDGFFKPLSYKLLIFMVLMPLATILIINAGLYRCRASINPNSSEVDELRRQVRLQEQVIRKLQTQIDALAEQDLIGLNSTLSHRALQLTLENQRLRMRSIDLHPHAS